MKLIRASYSNIRFYKNYYGPLTGFYSIGLANCYLNDGEIMGYRINDIKTTFNV